MDTKYADSFVVEGRLALPYQYFAGKTGSRFITTIRDQKTIMGLRCDSCGKVFVPPLIANPENLDVLPRLGAHIEPEVVRAHHGVAKVLLGEVPIRPSDDAGHRPGLGEHPDLLGLELLVPQRVA